ncbi:hypothetical protein IFM89_000909 [Coptis chinensis]|uniref:aspartyl aminopeptidase n=1 Tax=Coptis chinensis TaxID=261450 RepID=A0A835IJK3_9MAGN|nr:hypothetical protein IFM89_000909 [Coptis chinensis]
MEGISVLDFDMLCATVALQAQTGGGFSSREKLDDDYESSGEFGGGVQRMWEGEILDCFEDRRIAVETACCPCYRFGKNMRRAGFGPCFIQGGVYLILTVAAIVNYIAYAITNQRGFLYLAIVLTVSSGTYLGFFRRQIKKQFNIGALVGSREFPGDLASEHAIRMVALFDNEEVGSDSVQGAGALTRFQAMRRIVDCLSQEYVRENAFERAIRQSMRYAARVGFYLCLASIRVGAAGSDDILLKRFSVQRYISNYTRGFNRIYDIGIKRKDHVLAFLSIITCRQECSNCSEATKSGSSSPEWDQMFAFSKDCIQSSVVEIFAKENNKEDFLGRVWYDLSENNEDGNVVKFTDVAMGDNYLSLLDSKDGDEDNELVEVFVTNENNEVSVELDAASHSTTGELELVVSLTLVQSSVGRQPVKPVKWDEPPPDRDARDTWGNERALTATTPVEAGGVG